MHKRSVKRGHVTPLVILLLGVAILQYHSISFWVHHVGAATGIVWSALLEIAGLWLWYRKKLSTNLLGIVATLILLTGPIYEVSHPIISTYNTEQGVAEANLVKKSLLRADIRRLDTNLKVFLNNSQKRTGWQSQIEKTQNKLNLKSNKLQDLVSVGAAPKKRLAAQTWIVFVLQLTSIIFFQILNVLAIRAFNQPDGKNGTAGMNGMNNGMPGTDGMDLPVKMVKVKKPSLTIVENPDRKITDQFLLQLQQFVAGEMQNGEISIASFSENCGVPVRDLSHLMNYFKPGKSPRRKPSKSALTALEGLRLGRSEEGQL